MIIGDLVRVGCDLFPFDVMNSVPQEAGSGGVGAGSREAVEVQG